MGLSQYSDGDKNSSPPFASEERIIRLNPIINEAIFFHMDSSFRRGASQDVLSIFPTFVSSRF